MVQYYNVKCPHCRHMTYNNKPHCTNCGLLLSKTKDCTCDYCKRAIRKYESVITAALKHWYLDQCKFPELEARICSERIINDIDSDKGVHK